ncbi:MAG: HAD-IA family hydrolase [Marinoscillum sp.]
MPHRLSNLETIIFDLGEVVIDLDTDAVIAAFSKLTNGQGKNLRDLIVGTPHLYQYETGQMSDQEFVNAINGLIEADISLSDLRYAWNLMIKDVSIKRLEFMVELMQSHQVLILSNTNAMHEVCFDALIKSKTGKLMRDHSHTAYYSHNIGFRKPNRDIYEFVVAEQKLNPQKTLFLDDKLENIESARGVGLKAEQVLFPDQIFEILVHG